MDEANPFQSPLTDERSPVDPLVADGIWRDGNLVMMRRRSRLPDRCVRCNKPTRLRINVSLFAGGRLTGTAAAIRVGICERHRLYWNLGWIAAVVCWVVGYLALRFLPQLVPGKLGGILTLSALAVFWLGPIVALWWGRPVKAARIDLQFLWLRGFHRDYLRDLPPRR